MRLPASHANRRGLQFNITPLIDVVFLLIIFFLVASHIVRSEAQEPVDLPDAVQVLDDAKPALRLTITVSVDGGLSVGGTPLDLVELERRLNALAANRQAAEIRIRGDRQAAYRHVEPILRTCASLEITDVKFAVQKAPGR